MRTKNTKIDVKKTLLLIATFILCYLILIFLYVAFVTYNTEPILAAPTEKEGQYWYEIEKEDLFYSREDITVYQCSFKYSPVLGTIPKHSSVVVVATTYNGFAKIIYNSSPAFVKYNLLSDTRNARELVEFQVISSEGMATNVEAWKYPEFFTYMERCVRPVLVVKCDEFFNELPENIQNRFEVEGFRILISSVDLDGNYVNSSEGVCGLFQSGCKNIIIQDVYLNENILYHEMGHFVDHITGRTSRSVEFMKIYETEKLSFLDVPDAWDYEISAANEYFASAVESVILHPEKMNRFCPETFKFISRQIDKV